MSNLFARDEMDDIMQELVPIMKKEFPRRPPTNENLYEYFLSRARQNLHVVLCFSPVRNTLETHRYMSFMCFDAHCENSARQISRSSKIHDAVLH